MLLELVEPDVKSSLGPPELLEDTESPQLWVVAQMELEPLSEPRKSPLDELKVRREMACVPFHACQTCQFVLALYHKKSLQSWDTLVVRHLPHWEL